MKVEELQKLVRDKAASVQPFLMQASKAVTDAFELGMQLGIDIGMIIAKEGVEK